MLYMRCSLSTNTRRKVPVMAGKQMHAEDTWIYKYVVEACVYSGADNFLLGNCRAFSTLHHEGYREETHPSRKDR